MGRISLDNGLSSLDADEAMPENEEQNLREAVALMTDDDLREEIHREYAECTQLDFLTAYLDKDDQDFGIG